MTPKEQYRLLLIKNTRKFLPWLAQGEKENTIEDDVGVDVGVELEVDDDVELEADDEAKFLTRRLAQSEKGNTAKEDVGVDIQDVDSDSVAGTRTVIAVDDGSESESESEPGSAKESA